eukprot:CAMPEP_0206379570 /NCGR_PEP_ID=MMETSP0294-20121207/11445_1 /ASSEMBLY_ACC=CAM_ASM_000327 /TAXON_ID=39354 /ORGANISM="Heterosigma akashiwo, Strain CCMP2393" /LENGTH=89 /DNA_ID=CAMNT_0053828489 /DNA_START=297 /DNA_END=566 /DNA_ORIENTATION=+
MALPAHGTKVITMDMKKKELTSWELYQQERLPSILTWLFGAGLFAFAFSLYLGTSTNCDAAMVGNKVILFLFNRRLERKSSVMHQKCSI